MTEKLNFQDDLQYAWLDLIAQLNQTASLQGESYLWTAHYGDGTSLQEEGPDGHHRFAEIDQENLIEFSLDPQRLGLPAHSIHVELPWRLIFFRRKAFDWNGAEQSGTRTLHVIGRQATINGFNVKHLTAITESGATYTTSDDDLIEP